MPQNGRNVYVYCVYNLKFFQLRNYNLNLQFKIIIFMTRLENIMSRYIEKT